MSMIGGMQPLWCRPARAESAGEGAQLRHPGAQPAQRAAAVPGHRHLCLGHSKGGGDAGETPLQTAIRETVEECGLSFAPSQLLELGRFAYRPAKDLHLYATLVDGVDAADCHCSSQFTDFWGRRRPEMDAFEWTAFERVPRRCARRMAALLTQTLSLPQLMQRLQQRTE
jgi:putative (di)nucleoside polyphosphate hydrolase